MFISYVHEDKEHVDRLQARLEAAGVRVWRDTQSLWPGEDWRSKIQEAIRANALAFVACFSDSSNRKASTHQRAECVLAIDEFRRRAPDVPWLFPVRFSDCALPQYDLGAGRTLDSLQRADLFGERAEAEAARLVEAVVRVLSSHAAPGPPPAGTASAAAPGPAPASGGGGRAQARRVALVIGAAVALVASAVVATALFDRGGEDDSTDLAADTGGASETTRRLVPKGCPKPDGSSPRTLTFAAAPPMCIDPSKSYTAHVTTTEGNFDIALDTENTPRTANNFVVLARYHYYDDTSIFRIEESIHILQTGAPRTESTADPGPGYTIEDEGRGFRYREGDVVMARSQYPDSGSAQYFFVYGPNSSLLDAQGTYVTFGKVKGDGLAVLKQIGALYEPCPSSATECAGGRPRRPVVVKSITVDEP